jgi:PAS domain S-box-containing protein
MKNSEFEEVYCKVMKTRLPASFEVKSLIRGQWYEISVYPSMTGISAFWRDITERKKTEEALLESEEKYRMLFINMTEAFLLGEVIYDDDGKPCDYIFLDANPAYELQTGVKKERILGRRALELFPDASLIAIKKYGEVALLGQPTNFEFFSQALNRHLDVYVFSPEKGKFAVIFRDVTELKKAEEEREQLLDQIQQEKDRLDVLVKSIPDEVWFADAQKKITLVNPSATKFGFSDEEFEVEKLLASLEVYRQDGSVRPVEEAPSLRALQDEIVKNMEEIVRNPVSGELRYRQVNASPVFDKGGNIIGSICVARDITELKEAEIALQKAHDTLEEKVKERTAELEEALISLKESEEDIHALANIVESSNDAIVTESLEGIITSWNKGAEQVYGYSAEEIIGKDISILEPAHLKGEVKNLIGRIKKGIRIKNYETLRLKKDGTLINISVTLSPVFDSSGKLMAISAIARDITERIRTEKALAEVDKVRIKEIHHRIKNNLQVISSLLDLQSEKFQDKNVLKAFRESQDRVISMALIHEELYKGKEGKEDTLDFSEYIQKLAGSLFQTYGLNRKNISLCMDLEESIFFDMDVSVPLGIIVNELVSNSLKHAFSDRDSGEIRIELRRDESKDSKSSSITLTVSDNGVGVPEYLDIEDLESLGLQLVTTLVEQLDGELEVKRNNGTEFTMRFALTEKSNLASEPALQQSI